ncbi:MAG TPA: cellulase family glycosylhydrolase [Solirubrobacteraceae bacterium]
MRFGVRLAATAALLLSPLAMPSGAAALSSSSPGFLHAGPVGGPARIHQIYDAHGRQVLLRGVNVDGLVDYYRPDLRRSYPIDPTRYARGACPRNDPSVEGVVLCRRDFTQMRPLGYDSIRLNVSWSLLEPSPGHIDGRYINRIAQVVGWARSAGLYVILDMHQDAWSKYLYSTPSDHCTAPYQPIRGYDGAPRWASIHTQPVCALNGTRELDPAVEEDFAKLFQDAKAPDGVGLREHFTAVVAALARRFRNDPTVAGYDLLNEPTFFKVPGTDASVLLPFYAKVIAGVRHRVPGFRQLFFIEPGALRDVSDRSNITVSWSSYSRYRNVVYAPHVYTRTFTPRWFPMNGGYRSAVADTRHLGLPLWVGEFGSNPADTATVLTAHYREQDVFGLGGSLWLWKENANDINSHAFWGVYGPPFGPGVPQRDRIRLTSRTYPLYTAGNLQRLTYDATTGRFRMLATARPVPFGDASRATVLFISGPSRSRVRVRGARVRLIRLGRAREALVFPRGGAYSVAVG